MRQNISHIILSFALMILTVVNVEAATFEAGKTYVISQDIVLSTSETIAPDVTLIFQGGKITSKSAVTLTGNHTKIVAPIGRIFADKVSVKGSWDIDRAYPQWFGATTYDNFVNYNSQTVVKESGEAINKAIIMKQRGEVFLVKGIYIIANPIILHDGIILLGDRGMEMGHGDNDTNKYDGTILQSWKNSNTIITDSDDKYMIYVNAYANKQRITKGDFLSGQITAIMNVELYNYMPSITVGSAQELQNSTTACIKGIFAYESCQLDHVRFFNLRQALAYAGDKYIDNKQVTNCDYVCLNDNFKYLDRLYAYDFKWLGDNLMFEHNTIQDRRFNKGISLNNCNSGTIRCNIINADVNFSCCKGLDFSNNHMEGGPQITIKCSNLSMSNNYIERGHDIPMTVEGNESRDKSIVSMKNDMFIFIDRPRNYLEGKEGESTVNYNSFRNRMNNASEFDIAIDNNAIISFNQVFRYRLCDIADKSYPVGIKLCRLNDKAPFDEFNDFSYMLSQNGFVTSDFIVDKSFSVSNINAVEVYTAMKSDDTYWLASSGTYSYQYQVIYDKERKLLATRDGSQLFNVSTSQDLIGGLTQNNKGGVLLVIADRNGNAARATIRLIRKRNGSSGFSYVDIPNNNNHYLYDNGISVSGYPWLAGDNKTILSGATAVESISFQGDNVTCRIAGNPSKSQWKKGDMIINTGSDKSWNIQIK